MSFRNMFSPPRLIEPPAAPTGIELTLETARDRATDRHAQAWLDRPAELQDFGLRAEALLDTLAAADPEDLAETIRAGRRWLRSTGNRVPVRVLRPFQVGDAEVVPGTVAWLTRTHACQVVPLGFAEPAS